MIERQTEVKDTEMILVNQHIGWFQVAMENSPPM